MQNPLRTYTKTNPERETRPSAIGKRMEADEGSNSGDIRTPTGYQREKENSYRNRSGSLFLEEKNVKELILTFYLKGIPLIE